MTNLKLFPENWKVDAKASRYLQLLSNEAKPKLDSETSFSLSPKRLVFVSGLQIHNLKHFVKCYQLRIFFSASTLQLRTCSRSAEMPGLSWLRENDLRCLVGPI